ncbi:ATP-binding protein [Sulfitobacter marinus]|nr:ATP-binding protein [Sulfitobacter marinus]
MFSAVANLGLAAAALYGFPCILAVLATFYSRRFAYFALAVLAALLIVLAYLFVSGALEHPNPAVTEWNQNPRNWIVAIASICLAGALMIILIRNISEFWETTSEEVEENHRRFETLVEYAPSGIMTLDVDKGYLVSVNAQTERMFGVAREELLYGPTMADFTPEFQPSGARSDELATKYLQEAIGGGHPTYDWTHTDVNKKEFKCEVSLLRVPPYNKTLIRANITDITKRLADQKHREDLQSQLAASQRLETIGQLTGGVAHDFNNLLAVILGNLELMQEECTDEEQRQMIQPCIDATLRGAELTRNMLSYSRRAPLHPKIMDMNKLVRDTKNWAGRTLPSNVEIETSLLARLWKVKADSVAAESALLNLILNARDAMPDGGKLTIETSNVRVEAGYIDGRDEKLEAGRYVLVAVSDTGHGIADDDLEHIFTPFFSTKSVSHGSGLGLPMVMGFMGQSGGTVQVYSEVGIGTTFKLYFPAETSAPPEAALDVPQDQKSKPQGKRILLAEDEEEVRLVLTAMLQASGYAVQPAGSGDLAKEIFDADPEFDLLLTDIVMPGRLQGTGLAKELREMKDTLPVVFMSGYASEATVHGNGLRPEDVRLMKPVMRRDLLAAIKGALDASGNKDDA